MDKFELKISLPVKPKEALTFGISSSQCRANDSSFEAVETTVALSTHPSTQTLPLGEEPSSTPLSLTPAEGNEEEFPEGGPRAYLSVLGSFLGLIPTYGLPNSVGAIETYISQHQLSNVSASTVAWIFSLYTFFSFGSAIFSGAFFDHAGAKKPLIVGTLSMVGGLIGTAFSTQVWQFVLTFGALVGFGTGMLMSPLVGVVSQYFYKKRATFVSLATLGASVGGISIPMMLRAMYPTLGFKLAILVLSAFSLFFLLCSIALCQERMRKTSPPTHSIRSFTEVHILNMFDYKGLREIRFFFCSLTISLTESSLMIASIYFPSYAVMRGFSSNTGYLLVMIINATGVIGRLLPSYLSDTYLGPFNTCILTLLGTSVSCLVVWLPFGDRLGALYAFSALYGFFSGSALSISPVCIGQISRTEEFGKRFSTSYMTASFSMLALIPIAGAIIGDASLKRYNVYIIFVAMLALAAALSSAVVRVISVGWKLSKF